jgi:adenylate cyclase
MAMANFRGMVANAMLMILAVFMIAGIVFSVDYGARYSWLFWAEHWTSDWRATFLSHRPKGQHPRIALVKATETTVQQYTYRTPIDRGLVARLVTTIDAAGAETIAIDFLFLKATEPEKEEQLIAAIKAAKARVVVAVGDSRADLTPAQKTYQEDFLRRSGAIPGYANLFTGRDRIVRFIAPPVDEAYPQSFAVAAAKPDAVRSEGPRRIAWMLKPRDGTERFLEIPADLLAAPEGVTPPPAAPALAALLKGRIVMIGAELVGLDNHQTPLASWDGDDEMVGVRIHAQVAAQLIDNRSVERVSSEYLPAFYALLATFGLWIGFRYGSGGYSLYFGTATLTIAAIDIALFVFADRFLPFAACIVAMFAGLLAGIVLRRLARWSSMLLRAA